MNETPPARPIGSGRAALLAFLTAFITLFVQVLVHRVVSAKLLNNYAFLVISLTMLGFALSGMLLTRLRVRFLRRLHASLNLCAAAFVLTLLAGTVAFYRAPMGAQLATTRGPFLLGLAHWTPLALIFAVPFVFSGLVLGALLSGPFPAGRVYGADLAGSALGALAVVPAIGLMGVEENLLLACAVMLAGTALLAPSRARAAVAATAVAAAALGACTLARGHVFAMSYPKGSVLETAYVPASGTVIEHIAWDPLARIEVSRMRPPRPETMTYPSLIGTNALFLSRFERVITQNNYAFTYAVDYDGDPRSLRGIEETIYASAYEAGTVAHPRVMVIGVGGGFDVLCALRFEAAHVDAVEVNRATVNILRRTYHDYFRHWVEDPRVNLVHEEGRHYLATQGGQYDVIQLSGVDSYSGTPAAAHVFSENYLYTSEAFDLYLSHLAPDGVLNVMRLEFLMPREMLRAVVTAVNVLRRRGVRHPAQHIVTLTAHNGTFTAMLVKNSPFRPEEIERLDRWASSGSLFAVSAAPDRNQDRRSMYALFLGLDDPQLEKAFIERYPFNLEPATDNNPFFFRYSYWSHLWSSDPTVRENSVPVMEYSVVILLLTMGVVAAACVLLPLRLLAGEGLRAAGAGRWVLYFAGTGLGYMLIEIALLQKFGHFLGHPNYALSVVLAVLLLASGMGALASSAIVRLLGEVRFTAYALAAVLFVEYALFLPLLPRWITLPFSLRCAIVSALVLPVGLCLGVFTPVALERLKAEGPAFVPWAWGVNGVFSVMAPVAAVGLSITWGINALLLSAIPVYLGVGFAFPSRRDPSPAAAAEPAPA